MSWHYGCIAITKHDKTHNCVKLPWCAVYKMTPNWPPALVMLPIDSILTSFSCVIFSNILITVQTWTYSQAQCRFGDAECSVLYWYACLLMWPVTNLFNIYREIIRGFSLIKLLQPIVPHTNRSRIPQCLLHNNIVVEILLKPRGLSCCVDLSTYETEITWSYEKAGKAGIWNTCAMDVNYFPRHIS